MGRMFEVLRQAERALRSREESPADKAPGESADPGPGAEPEDGSPVSFIEVGPRHSIDGSPDVLACAPVRRPPAAEAVEPAAEARVVFRPLPARSRPDAGRPRLAPELVAFYSPALPAAEQYRNLLAALLPATGVRGDERCPVLAFTASQDEVGATTVVLNLAITAARQGRRRVIVVDANLRRPAVADRLGLDPAPGLREVLLGTATLDQALRPTEQPHLLALTAGLAEPGAGPRFVAETTRSLLRHLRSRADLVLVDGPPWDGRPEAGLLATVADAVYLVLPEKEAETPQADDLLQSIAEYGAKLAGCVLAGR